ncbi:hypothetical protein E2542_SST11564 [Spatholobus suberectus]|nr:hypothetical protein E2542_SST11564 [Spatholobus suberectus]
MVRQRHRLHTHTTEVHREQQPCLSPIKHTLCGSTSPSHLSVSFMNNDGMNEGQDFEVEDEDMELDGHK